MTFVQRFTDDQLRDELRRVSDLCAGPVTVKEFDRLSDASSYTVRRRFGGWRTALEVAGLADRYAGRVVSQKMVRQRSRAMTDEQIIAELQRVAKLTGSWTITQDDVRRHSPVLGVYAPRSRFGSFQAAAEAAGLRVPYRRYTDEDLIGNLRAVAAELGLTPKGVDADRPPSTIGRTTYYDRFGSWPAALGAAGLGAS